MRTLTYFIISRDRSLQSQMVFYCSRLSGHFHITCFLLYTYDASVILDHRVYFLVVFAGSDQCFVSYFRDYN